MCLVDMASSLAPAPAVPTARSATGIDAAQPMTCLHRARSHRTALLEQEDDVRTQRRAQRQPRNHRSGCSTTAEHGGVIGPTRAHGIFVREFRVI
jgi:hypothetical protein